MSTKHWRVDIVIDERGGGTRAEARLRGRDDTALAGAGLAPHVPAGDELAVASALSDLAGQLRQAPEGGRADHPWRRRLTEVAGYVGGGLMLGGAALLVATSWAELSRPARITLLVAVSVTLLVAGTLVAGRALFRRRAADSVRSRLAGVLYALAAGTTALTAGTATRAYEVFWGALAGLAVAVLGYLAVRSVAGVLASAVLSAVVVGQLVAEVLGAGPVVLGAGLVLLGLAWAALTASGVLAQQVTGYSAGTVIALVGAQQPLGEPGAAAWAYGATFCVALVWLAGYFWLRSVVLLCAGILGLTIAVPEAVWDWTDGSAGGAVIALVAGAVLLTMSGVGIRLNSR